MRDNQGKRINSDFSINTDALMEEYNSNKNIPFTFLNRGIFSTRNFTNGINSMHNQKFITNSNDYQIYNGMSKSNFDSVPVILSASSTSSYFTWDNSAMPQWFLSKSCYFELFYKQTPIESRRDSMMFSITNSIGLTGSSLLWDPPFLYSKYYFALFCKDEYGNELDDFTYNSYFQNVKYKQIDAKYDTGFSAWPIYSIAKDDEGNYYLGGAFFAPYTFMIKLGPDGTTLDTTFQPNFTYAANSGVNSIIISGSYIFAGGKFATVSGTTRNNFVCLDLSGNVQSVNPNVGSTVRSMSLSGSNIYLGGDFTTISGATRERIAAIDKTTGALQPFNAGACDGNVYTISAVSGSVYVGGAFDNLSGSAKAKIAKLDGSTAIYDVSWSGSGNPQFDDTVRGIDISGTSVYAAGSFSSITASGSTQSRAGFCILNDTNGNLNSFNEISIAGAGYFVKIYDDRIFVCGNFNSVNSNTSQQVYVYDLVNSSSVYTGQQVTSAAWMMCPTTSSAAVMVIGGARMYEMTTGGDYGTFT